MSSSEVFSGLAQDSKRVTTLPHFLTTSWRLDPLDELRTKRQLLNEKWTVTSLAEKYLEARLPGPLCSFGKSTNKGSPGMTSSLVAVSISKIIEALEDSESLEADIKTVIRSLNFMTLRQVLKDPMMSYGLLRAFLSVLERQNVESKVGSVASLRDVDEAILLNEHHIRSRTSESNKDAKYLVTLEGLVTILGKPNASSQTLHIRRKDPPPGGFEFLDEKRQRTIQILTNDETFSSTFSRTTCGILQGLDWQNVLIAGGSALATLLHVDESRDCEEGICDGDIDIYLYGLDFEGANKKVEHIYNVWSSNLPTGNRQKLVVKNAKTITFLPDYPNRRVQIVLKLLPSPTEILLNIDIDPCAIGFDGTHVKMLPRCARAIETGYSTFTMDLIWGHYLGSRRASRENRLFKYADRGFGLRILPCYVQSLEDDSHWNAASTSSSSNDDEIIVNMSSDSKCHCFDYRDYSVYKKPGSEPGLKSLRRVACVGESFTDEFYIRYTTFARSLISDRTGVTAYKERWAEWKAYKEDHERRRTTTSEPLNHITGPLIDLAILDSRIYRHGSIPNGLAGLGTFEMFMRHCEAWRLDARGEATLDRTAYPDFGYDDSDYNDTPQYGWNENFEAAELARCIDRENNASFDKLKHGICAKIGIPYQAHGYKDYLTRRIRRQVHGPDLQSVMERQITIPLVIPYDLESYLTNDMLQNYPSLTYRNPRTPLLIPVHDPTSYSPTAVLPSLQERVSEDGNLRYWIINNENMWACQSRPMDEIFEVLWSLFHCFNQLYFSTVQCSTSHPKVVWDMARMFRRRAVLPESIFAQHECVTDLSRSSTLSIGESLLFRAWVYAVPRVSERRIGYDMSMREPREEPLHLPCVPDDGLFWTDGDEGDWNGGDVPQWVDVHD